MSAAEARLCSSTVWQRGSEAARQGGRVYLHLACLWDEHGKDVKKRIYRSSEAHLAERQRRQEGKIRRSWNRIETEIDDDDVYLRNNAPKKHLQSA